MNDEAAFVAAIAAAPDDHHLPLVFADWLDDHGDPRGQWLRHYAVRGWLPPTYENPVLKLLESLAKNKRVIDVRRAAEVIGEPLVPGLVELLKHEKPRVREQACMCLRKIGKRAKAAVPALLDALASSEHNVREQAAKAASGDWHRRGDQHGPTQGRTHRRQLERARPREQGTRQNGCEG